MGRHEELSDQTLGQSVVPLTEVDVTHDALGVDQVLGRPVLVVVGVPRSVVVVDGDRVVDAERLGLRLDVADDVFEGELRRVHADDLQPVGGVALVPGLDVRQRTLTVDARVRPEVDDARPCREVPSS